MNSEFEYIGFGKRVAMSIVELIVVSVPFVFLYTTSLRMAVQWESVIPFILQWMLVISLLIFMITRYGATPGKLIMKAKIVDRNGNYLSVGRAVLRLVIYSLNSILLVFALDAAIRHGVPYEEVGGFISDYEGEDGFHIARMAAGVIAIIDIVWLFLNRKRRTLHDLLAGSYVVSVDSYHKNKAEQGSSHSLTH
ncbi:RDD family protein [Paenibacillus mucilaginosus]|uniref:RDD domain-containing protein n=1 Tax=Paenibacillus mucilaginosus (strain KNP414) TaxID=1036673 RepID=F8FJR2_PAEMK|nr:RDD family protein [Paenibacillus mucilaginosus]AEI43393.1 hypothetical protein KNP414_04867 [Paenibacillus mucilaginosus KNP414]MCG7212060.1 RDD family protein [Paenibacillus mucilaginosus]WDM24955.1 RDD family protein [Paenibacillus mucilaginosus]